MSNLPTCTCGACRKCRQRAYSARWRANNPEKVRAYTRSERNREAQRERERRYVERNPERRAEIGRAYRERHPERARETKQAYYERNREAIVAKRHDYGERWPEKDYARSVVNNAITAGKMSRGACEVGVDCYGRIEAHHDDYDRPLDIRWLCQRHHELHHRSVS